MAKQSAAADSRAVFTCVRVALRGREALHACTELLLLIQEFVDYPVRWMDLPATRAVLLARAHMTSVFRRDPESYNFRPRSPCEELLDWAMMAAAARGYLHALTWLSAYYGPSVRVSRHVMDVAVAHSHLDIAQWLHANRNEECSEIAMVVACRARRLDIMEWLVENTTSKCPSYMASHVMLDGGNSLSSARARNGDRASVIEVLQWLHTRALGGEYEAADIISCATCGYLDIVKYLHETCTAGSAPEAMDTTAEYGHFEIVQFLHEHRTEGRTTRAMDKTAERNDLDIVRFLHENRAEGCTTAAMDAAARAGHLRMIVKFLHKNRSEGCSPRALISAVFAHNLELLQWLFEKYRPKFTPAIIQAAIENARRFRHTEIAVWLKEVQVSESSDE